MKKSKHLVQAQRKFAAGAVVPAQAQVERRAEPAPAALPPPEPSVVRHCGMPATQLVNWIMMRSIHTHAPVSQPVVLLERLLNDNDSQKNNEGVKTQPKPTKKAKSIIQKESPSKQAACGSLGSKRRSESTDGEDNRPLKYLKKIKLRKMVPNTTREVQANTSRVQRPRISRVRAHNSPTRSCTSPVRARTSLARARTSPVRDRISPVRDRISPVRDRISPVRVRTSPVRARTSPVRVRTSPVRARTSPVRARNRPVRAQTCPARARPARAKRMLAPSRALVRAVGDTSPPSTTVKGGDQKRKTLEATPFKTPRPPRRGRPAKKTPAEPRARCACGEGYCGSCERCSILSSVIAMGDKVQKADELERVVADLVDRAQRSPSARPPATSAAASSAPAPDVYAFREEVEAERERSPFRARALRPFRSHSVDPTLCNRVPDTEYIIRVLDMQTRVLTSYIRGRDGATDATDKHVNKLIQILDRYKSKLLLNDLSSKSIVIDVDEPSSAITTKPEPSEELSAGDSAFQAFELRYSPDNESLPGTEIPTALPPPEPADDDDGPEIAEAPAFYPTMEEMMDLNHYIDKIEPVARKYGTFKIVPPRDFQPPCVLKNVQFKSTNQYISSMYSRWGPAASEMTAIKAHLATQNVAFTRPPLFEGVEVDLVKLYQLVQEHGGLYRVMEERKWGAIAERMQLNARAGHVKADVRLDKIYMKYLLPYETLSEEERKQLRARVDFAWRARYNRQRARAAQPLHRKRRLLGESESSEEDEPEPAELATAFLEVEDCVVPGPNMDLTRFQRVGERVRDMHFPGASEGAPPHWADVERAYWRLVRSGTDHVCVHGAALDTSQNGLGFPAAPDTSYGSHPWNLKRLGESERNVLSALGPTLAVTVPTLHLGMMFSTNCWHLDPHHLPWTEYMHQGPPKIWYGIAASESAAFRAAAEQLCPTAVQRKALWLPSDSAMLPPRLLAARGVRLVRALQAPGEYVVVLPRSYSCSISTGFTVSESLYFAGDAWLDGVDHIFAALHADAEPSMFALEALLEGVVRSPASPSPSRLLRAHALLRPLLQAETSRRRRAAELGVRTLTTTEYLNLNRRCSKTSWQVARGECYVCRATLYWSKIIDTSSRVSLCLEDGLRLVSRRISEVEETLDVDAYTAILIKSDVEMSDLANLLDLQLSQLVEVDDS